jgi:hypothetical protein
MQPSDVVSNVCAAVGRQDLERAQRLLQVDYPHVRPTMAGRQHSVRERTNVFVRDGFVDRYSGLRLVFPGTLRLLSLLLPDDVPFHPNWKTDACHRMFWELYPTIDHIYPVARGGPDTATNWVYIDGEECRQSQLDARRTWLGAAAPRRGRRVGRAHELGHNRSDPVAGPDQP